MSSDSSTTAVVDRPSSANPGANGGLSCAFEVLRQVFDLFCEQGDLNFRRTRVMIMQFVLIDDFFLGAGR